MSEDFTLLMIERGKVNVRTYQDFKGAVEQYRAETIRIQRPTALHEYKGLPVPFPLHDRKGGAPAEWPADLCVREYPQCAERPA